MKKKKIENSIALYTKHRPKDFSEILGQDHIVNVLSDSINNSKISHAYLFTGMRGTGKTSIARIFAQKIGTTQKDLYEIDAASNNSVENIRDLNESINVLPFDSKYKVYILDEVHMLSKSAFNALLKTLEEPPAYVVFILATTEPEKIPDTVMSRCEVYNFKTPNREILKKLIQKTAKKENYEIEASASELISILADGSFRDAQTLLQKMLRVSSDKKITVEEVEEITGAPKTTLVNEIIESLVLGSLEKGLNAIKVSKDQNLDIKVLLKLLLEKYRALLLLKISPNQSSLYEDIISEDDLKWLKDLINKEEAKVDSTKLSILLEAANEINYSPLPYLPLEVALIEINSK